MMAAGKLGMYVGGTGDMPNIVNQYKGRYEDYGLGVHPRRQGHPGRRRRLHVQGRPDPGEDQGRADSGWRSKLEPRPRRTPTRAGSTSEEPPVGLPEPNIWTGASEQKLIAANKQYANVPADNYKPFDAASAGIPLKVEPPNAQQVYAALDTVMQKVLTDPNANIDQLLQGRREAGQPDPVDSQVTMASGLPPARPRAASARRR